MSLNPDLEDWGPLFHRVASLLEAARHSEVSSVSIRVSPVSLVTEAVADLLLALANHAEAGWAMEKLNPELVSRSQREEWPFGLDPSSSEGFERIVSGPTLRHRRRKAVPPNPKLAKRFRELSFWFVRYGRDPYRGDLPADCGTSRQVQYHYHRRNRRGRGTKDRSD